MATHLKISERWWRIMWIITKFSGLTPVLHPLCSKRRRKFVQTPCALESRFISLIFVAGSHSVTHAQLRKAQQTYVKHFKLNRTFKVIQGHPYWCQQESRTVCCRNVQLMPTSFLKLTKIWQRKTANSSISATPLGFEDVPSRNAFEYLQMVYSARNYRVIDYICAADSRVLRSLVFTELCLKVEPSESKTAS